jgi:hypothetical protein
MAIIQNLVAGGSVNDNGGWVIRRNYTTNYIARFNKGPPILAADETLSDLHTWRKMWENFAIVQDLDAVPRDKQIANLLEHSILVISATPNKLTVVEEVLKAI